MKVNGLKKEFIIDTGSLITIMPPDEKIRMSIGIPKITNRYQDVNKNEEKIKIRKQQTKNGNIDKRKNTHNTYSEWIG